MTLVRLGDVITSVGGGTPARANDSFYGGTIPWVTPKDMKTWEIADSQVRITEAGLANSAARLVPPGSVLIVVRSGVLKHSLPVAVTGASVAINQDMRALVPTPSIDARYLAHLLRSQAPVILGWVRATTADNFSVPRLMDLKIPLPPMDKQRKIARMLDRAAEIQARRTNAINLLDELGSASFHAIFDGREESNPAWAIRPLGEVADLYAGGTLPPGEPYRDQADGVFLMKVSDMNRAGNEREIKCCALWTLKGGTAASTCPPGSVVIPKRGGAIGTNKKRITTRPTVLDPNLMAISPRPELVTSEYLHSWFERFDLASISSGSSVPQLNKKDLAPLPIAVPPMSVQDDFQRRQAAVSRQRSTLRAHLASVEVLCASLEDRAFSGRL